MTVECMGKALKLAEQRNRAIQSVFSYKKQIYILQYTAYLYGVAIFYVMMIFTI